MKALALTAAALLALAPVAVVHPATAQGQATAQAAGPQTRDQAKVDRAVADKVRGGGTADFWVRFRGEADLSGASSIRDWTERGRYVVDKLREASHSDHASAVAQLKRENLRHHEFWAVNAVLVRGGGEKTVEALKHRPEVTEIREHRTLTLPVPQSTGAASTGPVEWGVADIGADRAWEAFGARGEGVVVANIDTGVQFDHPALARQYRGRNADGSLNHEHNWYDPSQVCGDPTLGPCDNNGHGTHTMGTMVGDDGATNHIGVAPGARWIAAKGCEEGFCSEFALVSSGQWVLAPTTTSGTDPDPALRPHVVNNSWGGGGSSDWYRDLVRAWVAAGMFPAFANGNSGYGVCGTVDDPGGYAESYGVGAYDIQGRIAEFSSLGPSPHDDGVKPDASAPGVDVRSAVPGGGYDSFSGTSMATPHVAGAVALMLSAATALVGDVAATRVLLDSTARDAPDSAGCGGTAGDNNTFGEGRIDVLAAIDSSPRGPVGTLAGTVSDASTGAPVADAEVTITGGVAPRQVRTGADGTYGVTLATGTYEVAVTAYAHEPASATATITTGTTTRDFALTPLPRSVVRGTIRDGAGHGWPLYARLDIAGFPGGPVFTDPVTSAYSVELVHGRTYDIAVTALLDGYTPASRAVVLPADPTTQDFALAATSECGAPGYTFGVRGVYESFDGPTTPPGWQVVDNAGTGQVWAFEDHAFRGNRTGGEGGFAIVDSDYLGGVQDTELVTPTVDLTGVDAPRIEFKQDIRAFADEVFDVDLSTDGGASWTTVWRNEGSGGTGSLSGPRTEAVPIPAAAGQSAVKVRFHYYDANFAWWWQVDDVLVGAPACVPLPGGLVVGNATDGRTGAPVDGVEVASAPDAPRATTGPTPDDPAVPDGFYALFVPGSGTTTLTATKKLYGPTPLTADVVADSVVRRDFPLRSGHLVFGPAVTGTTELGGRVESTLTVTNDGTADARLELSRRAGEVTIARAGAAPADADRTGAAQAVRRTEAAVSPDRLDLAPAADPAGPAAPPWRDIADHPLQVMDNSVAAGPDGRVYSVGGYSPSEGMLDHLYVYEPRTDTWSRAAATDELREKPAAAFVGDKLYVVGGFDDFGINRAAKRTGEVYDPATGRWQGIAQAPYGSAAAGTAVLGGKLYLVGGCSGDVCTAESNAARYDPATNTWQSLRHYPEGVAWGSCAGDEARQRVYCAGGVDFVGKSSAYAYDPATDEWTPIAALPVPLWGSVYAAANGKFVVSGGVTGDEVTNEGYAYDPFADAWDPVPPAGTGVYRGGGACGLYRIGGVPAASATSSAEVLPEYGHCDTADVPWLSVSPGAVTVPAGATVELTVVLDSAQVDQPGTHAAALVVSEDTPYAVSPVPVALTATPPPTWGKISGSLTGLGRCDVGSAPLARSTVDVDGAARDFHLAVGGSYEVWTDQANGPVGLTVSAPGFVGQTRSAVPVVAGAVSTVDFALRADRPCAEVSPSGLDLAVEQGVTSRAEVVLRDRGAGSMGYSVAEVPFLFDPVSGGPGAIAGTGWFGGAPLPEDGRHQGRAQCDGDVGRFFVFGGVDRFGKARATAWRYDVGANTWTELAPLPTAVESPTAVCELGRIHVLGGSGTTAHQVYDTSTDTWSTATALPRPVRGAASAVWDGRVYLAGGDADFTPGGTSGAVDVYDPRTGAWTAGPALPVAVVGAGSVQAGQHLYLVGGWHDGSPGQNATAVQRLDLATGTWTTGPALPSAPADLALAATDQALYAIGGDSPGGGFTDGTDAVHRLALGSWPAGGWTADDRLPLRVSGNTGFCTVGFLGGEVWSVGGVDQFGAAGLSYLHDIGTERCASMRADVAWLSVTPTSGDLAADGTQPLAVTVDATGLAPGVHVATVLVSTTDPGAPELRVPVRVTVSAPAAAHLISLPGSGSVGGVEYADEDVLGVTATGRVVPVFDGSDVGVGDLAVDALVRLPDGSLLLSFTKPGAVPGITGRVDDSDLVRFAPTSLGATTSGTFTLWLDGSDVGLTTDAEDVDAADVLPDGRVVLSTEGVANVPGVTAADADLVIFTPTSLGEETAGTYALWFDGRDVGLAAKDENVDAVAVAADGRLGLSTTGPLAVAGLSAGPEDVAAFRPDALGPDTRGTFDSAVLFDGTALGLRNVTAYEVG
ncbi:MULTISPECIES: S8 family serine peptidase [unclassified Saccharothrix]|uniref:S8 family serine peptidase n=1 Tax=unclassified Saccharothrix TaxID=2593673 RepID=UPI00307D8914